MENARSAHILYFLKHFYQAGKVVAVKWPEIAYVQPLEYVLLACQKRFQTVVEAQDASSVLFRDKPDFTQEIISL